MTGAPQVNPTVARRELAMIFRAFREQQKRSLEEVASHLGVSVPQASRLDTGARGFRPEDVRRLADWYGLPAAEVPRLLVLAEESRRRGWWQQVEVPPSYRTLIGMEQAAESINEYGGLVIPGLLQTRKFAEAATAAVVLDIQPERIRQLVDVRMRRQEVLERGRPPELWVILDEAVLARTTGGSGVMLGQLEHLVTSATRPHITIQVIGFDYGLYPGQAGHFILLGMGGNLPDVIYTEDLIQISDSSEADEVRNVRKLWDSLRAIALSPRASVERIEQYAGRLRK